ncbi:MULTISPECIES: hypothetical protein [Hyphomonas]|uniref:hypothetical protein n=1 Tax=Hyphomonas TaxID=85 RepID=UPI003511858B
MKKPRKFWRSVANFCAGSSGETLKGASTIGLSTLSFFAASAAVGVGAPAIVGLCALGSVIVSNGITAVGSYSDEKHDVLIDKLHKLDATLVAVKFELEQMRIDIQRALQALDLVRNLIFFSLTYLLLTQISPLIFTPIGILMAATICVLVIAYYATNVPIYRSQRKVLEAEFDRLFRARLENREMESKIDSP